MNAVIRRVGSAISPLALVIALLALVVSAAGAGYAAGQIGTGDIKNNAITAKKIKKNAVTGAKIADGSVGAADLAKQEKQKKAVLANGGEGDCVWQSGGAIIPGLGAPTYRKDLLGTVHLAGVAVAADGGGGDMDCDSGAMGQSADGIAFVLPAGYVPARTLLIGGTSSSGVLVVGVGGLNTGSAIYPAGAVASLSSGSGAVAIDGVSFLPAGSKLVAAKVKPAGRVTPELLGRLGLN